MSFLLCCAQHPRATLSPPSSSSAAALGLAASWPQRRGDDWISKTCKVLLPTTLTRALAILLGCLGAYPTSCTCPCYYQEFKFETCRIRGKIYCVYEKFLVQSSYLFNQLFPQNFHWSKLSVLLPVVLLQKTKNNLPYYWVLSSWDRFWPVGLCFTIGFIRAAKHFVQEIIYRWNQSKGGYLNSFFYHLSSVSNPLIAPMCLYKFEKQPCVWKFNFLPYRAQLKSASQLPLVLLSSIHNLNKPRKYCIERREVPLDKNSFWSMAV